MGAHVRRMLQHACCMLTCIQIAQEKGRKPARLTSQTPPSPPTHASMAVAESRWITSGCRLLLRSLECGRCCGPRRWRRPTLVCLEADFTLGCLHCTGVQTTWRLPPSLRSVESLRLMQAALVRGGAHSTLCRMKEAVFGREFRYVMIQRSLNQGSTKEAVLGLHSLNGMGSSYGLATLRVRPCMELAFLTSVISATV